MENDRSEISLEEVLKQLDEVTYENVAEKMESNFDEFYATFIEQYNNTLTQNTGFTNDIDLLEFEKEMIVSTYSLALESLNNAMNMLEYSYALSKSIEKVCLDKDLKFNEYVARAIVITNGYIKQAAQNMELSIHNDVADILKELQNKREDYE